MSRSVRLCSVAVWMCLLAWLMVSWSAAQTTSPAAPLQSKAPKIWDAKELAMWATPIAGVNAKPHFYSEEEYYAAPVDNLRTYPVYHPDREPKGYQEWLKKQGARLLIDAVGKRANRSRRPSTKRRNGGRDEPRATRVAFSTSLMKPTILTLLLAMAAVPGLTADDQSRDAPKRHSSGRPLPKMPAIVRPVAFDTPEADRILEALQVFPADNPWNQDISSWPVHPNSAKIIASIGAAKPLRYNADMSFILVPPGQKKIADTTLRDPMVIEPDPQDPKTLAHRVKSHSGDILFLKHRFERLHSEDSARVSLRVPVRLAHRWVITKRSSTSACTSRSRARTSSARARPPG